MSTYIVPNELREAILRRVDAAILEAPDAAPDRELFYIQLLSHYAEHGVIPEFSLVNTAAETVSATPDREDAAP